MEFPKNETVWVRQYDENGTLQWIITSKNKNRDRYYLYQNKNDKFVKVSQNQNPMILEDMTHKERKKRKNV